MSETCIVLVFTSTEPSAPLPDQPLRSSRHDEDTCEFQINSAAVLNLFVITLEPINKNSSFLITSLLHREKATHPQTTGP